FLNEAMPMRRSRPPRWYAFRNPKRLPMRNGRPTPARCVWLAAVLAAALGAPRSGLGQTTGLLEGTIRDSFGGPLPGAGVSISSASLQGTRTLVTGRDGIFRFPAVPPGEYRVHTDLPGFRQQEKTATIKLDATATADFALEPEVAA